MTEQKAATKDVHVTRMFDAPVQRVWKALSDPELVMRWWGPNYFSSPSCSMDFREGGRSILCMRSPDGIDMYNSWEYQKIVPLERIEFVQRLCDKDGGPIDPASIGVSADFPAEVRSILTLKKMGAKTEMTIVEYGFPDSQLYEFAVMGLEQSLEKMAQALA
jgi:uncharacterized protein YndB with AHSA1/START domain